MKQPCSLMAIGWPAFLAACLMEFLVFGFVDPTELRWFGHVVEMPRQAVYALAFFAFWIVSVFSSATTALLMRSPAQVNGQAGSAGQR